MAEAETNKIGKTSPERRWNLVVLTLFLTLAAVLAWGMFGASLLSLPEAIEYRLRPESCPVTEEHEWEDYSHSQDGPTIYRCKKCRQTKSAGGGNNLKIVGYCAQCGKHLFYGIEHPCKCHDCGNKIYDGRDISTGIHSCAEQWQ